jgi:uncharacterized protein (DUF433 family)
MRLSMRFQTRILSGREMLVIQNRWPEESELTMNRRVEINAEVMQGKPLIRGTRIPVELLLCKLAEGAPATDLLDAYPRLVPEDIRAALDYAGDTIAHETVLSLSSK